MKNKNSCGEAFIDWLSTSGAGLNPLAKRRSEGLFATKNAVHMLIGRERNSTFDNDSFLFEPAFGGLRAFAYLSPGESVLMGKHGLYLPAWFPEFANLNKQVAQKCILDGEVVLFKNGKPDVRGYGKRLSLKDPATISKTAHSSPAVFVVNDIVYSGKRQVTDLPLIDRKELLDAVVSENKSILISRYLRGQGNMLYRAAKRKSLEGIVAKHKNSQYHFGFKSPDWIAIKSFLYDNFIICGFMENEQGRHLVLGQYDPMGVILYRGIVTLNVPTETLEEDYETITSQRKLPAHAFSQAPPEAAHGATWIAPTLVCSVSFSARDEQGNLENPAYRSLRLDKTWEETVMQEQGGLNSDPDMSGWIMGPWS